MTLVHCFKKVSIFFLFPQSAHVHVGAQERLTVFGVQTEEKPPGEYEVQRLQVRLETHRYLGNCQFYGS